MRKTTTSYIRRFKCPECGCEVTAPKMSKTGNGHIKTMYCVICREKRDFVQIGVDKLR
jgi:transcription elongation factor Elf1